MTKEQKITALENHIKDLERKNRDLDHLVTISRLYIKKLENDITKHKKQIKELEK